MGPALLYLLALPAHAQAPAPVLTSDYPSIQAAIDANPGRMILVPAGEHRISEPLLIRADGSGLCGPGTIVQADNDADIVRVQEADGVSIEGLTLTRSEDARECIAHGIWANGCEGLKIDSVRVIDNRSARAVVRLESCHNATVSGCEIVNYKRVSIDDRTADAKYGYAFRCIDGTGIQVEHCTDVRLAGNRIVERAILPTREFVEQNALGQVVKRNEQIGRLAPNTVEREGRVTNWHQGSAILVTGPRDTQRITIEGNLIGNAGQGIDIHADQVEVTGNVVTCAFIGIKAMHGSSEVRIAGNVFSRVDLWGILLSPGSASAADNPERDLIVEGNVISDTGYGNEYWHWSTAAGENNPIAVKLESGPLPENPPMVNVTVRNNVVATRDPDHPRHRWALWIDPPPTGPQDVHVSGNAFAAGTKGVANAEVPE
ncbi:MAG: hypothetical protein FJX75_06695 [Armatimonadetes bacterium]|nr:hypothetical protein [Armatimonadota bacterium]